MANALTSFLEKKLTERLQKDYRYSFSQFARDLGVLRENLQGYMNPNLNREPRLAQCVSMAKGLGLTLLDFLVQTELIPKEEAARSGCISMLSTDGLPEAVQAAIASPDWAELFNYSDEIAMLSTMPGLTDAESVIQAIRDLPIHKMKALFQEHHAPRKIQEDCYRHCAILVKDWSESAGDKWS